VLILNQNLQAVSAQRVAKIGDEGEFLIFDFWNTGSWFSGLFDPG
jgi:hypothetical protein